MYLSTWEEFEKSAQSLYLKDPMNIRYVMKYTHNKNILKVKITDDKVLNWVDVSCNNTFGCKADEVLP